MIKIDNLEERGPYVEKTVPLGDQEWLESEEWETFAYEEYCFNGNTYVPRYAVMRYYEKEVTNA